MPSPSRFLSGFAAFAAIVQLASAGSDCQVLGGISYCQETSAITYNSVGFSGSYSDVIGTDAEACTCKYAPKSFSGGLAPLNEELSFHFRGPIRLKKFAAYTPSTSSDKKKRTEEHHIRRHAHNHKRDVRVVTSTTTITVTVLPTATGAPVDVAAISSAVTSASSATPSESQSGSSDSGDWSRISFYDAEQSTADGLVFLNHMGGQGSGTFDLCFGNSISYANGTANGGSANSEILQDVLVPSNNEFIIMTDKKCEGDNCGYYRPNTPAYHGFGGENKVFLFEFQMPEDKNGPEFNSNTPAVWALNAKIPRTAQYGKLAGGDNKASCSCWDTGCGEMDLFETLVGADDFLKTHYHSEQGTNTIYGGGGSPDYFARPYTKPIQAAVIFKASKIFITILDKATDFSKVLSSDFVSGCEKTISVFSVPT